MALAQEKNLDYVCRNLLAGGKSFIIRAMQLLSPPGS